MRRLNMFGPGSGPLINRLAAQSMPVDYAAPVSEVSADPIGHHANSPKPLGIKEATRALTGLLMDVEQSDERDSLLRQWIGLSEQIEAFVAEVKAKHKAELERRVAELTPLCRASLDRLTELKTEARRLEGRLHVLEDRRGTANMKLRVALESKPDDETFPTDDEIAEWGEEVETARASVESATSALVELQEEVEAKYGQVRVEQMRLTELKRQREDARLELAGQPRKGPHGLVIPAGS